MTNENIPDMPTPKGDVNAEIHRLGILRVRDANLNRVTYSALYAVKDILPMLEAGKSATEVLAILDAVEKKDPIYVPNLGHPRGDGENFPHGD